MKKNNGRLKIIPDVVFHKLWDASQTFDNINLFIRSYTVDENSEKIKYKKYGLDIIDFSEMLRKIYTYAHCDINDIIYLSKKKKSEISHIFCIPIRTIEDWSNGKGKCSSYMRLMLLRHFHIINLGKYIKVQSEIDYKMSEPAVYKRNTKTLAR